MLNPLITVCPSVFTPETPYADFDTAPTCRVMPLREALHTDWPGDACALNYAHPDLPHRFNDTLRKNAGVDDLAAEMWAALTVGVVFADLDIPPHGETPRQSAEGGAFLAGAVSSWPAWLGAYGTPFGLRLFAVLPEPVGVGYTESANAAFFALLEAAGIRGVDTGLKKWNRLNRLPYVNRPDVGRTEPDFIVWPEAPAPIPAGLLTPCALGTGTTAAEVEYGPCPDVAADYRPFVPEAAAAWADVLNGVVPLAPRGGRHNALSGLLGVLFNVIPELDAEHAFRLIIRAVRACGLPEEEAWKQVVHRAATHTPRAVEAPPEAAPEPDDGDDAAAAFLGPEWRRRLLIYNTADPDKTWVYDPRLGRFNAAPVATKILPEVLRAWWKSGFGLSVPLTFEREAKGGVETVRLSGPALQSAYGVGVGAVEVAYVQPPDPVVFSGGTYTARLAFTAPRPDLAPLHTPEIAEWLRLLDPTGRLEAWLSWAPELAERLPALVLIGAPGTGKTLLANALASLWGPAPVAWESVASNSASALLTQPVIFRDEAPVGSVGSDMFRRITGAASLPIVEKYRPTVVLDGSPRVVIASNEKSIIQFRKENLSGHSAEAVRQRTVLVEVDDAPKTWLLALGPRVREWVSTPDAPGLLARHIAWLSANARPPRAADRFAVPASGLDTVALEATSAGVRELLQALAFVLHSAEALPPGFKAVRLDALKPGGDAGPAWALGVAPVALERELKAAGLRVSRPGELTDNVKSASLATDAGGGKWAQRSVVQRVDGKPLRVWPVRLDLLQHAADDAGVSLGPLEGLRDDN